MILILGAGLSGLSTSYHVGHESCLLLEKNNYVGGHIYTDYTNGFTWDEGPHVSFTSNEYVKELFAESLNNEFLEYPVKTTNYYKGNWIPHPAQSNLYAVPSPLKERCLEDFLSARESYEQDFKANNYKEWLEYAFGKTFSINFPSNYTKKYWTLAPEYLDTDWVGERVFFPDVEEVKEGFVRPLKHETHYIKTIRYPKKGGYISYAKKIAEGANVKLGSEVVSVDLKSKTVQIQTGEVISYDKLINTLPLPVFINLCNPPNEIKENIENLACSSALIINIMVSHVTKREENWMYIYDEDKYSTRINCTELLSPNNAPKGKTGVQVEVYYSKYKTLKEPVSKIVEKVCEEVIEMGLIESKNHIEDIFTKQIKWANVIFDKKRQKAQDEIFSWLENQGLIREPDDLKPMTNWESKFNDEQVLGDLILAGRFGQWKYYWTDDCILRGKYVSKKIKHIKI